MSERVLALAGTPATEEEKKEVWYVNTLQIQVQIKVYNNNCTAIPCDAVHGRLEPNIQCWLSLQRYDAISTIPKGVRKEEGFPQQHAPAFWGRHSLARSLRQAIPTGESLLHRCTKQLVQSTVPWGGVNESSPASSVRSQRSDLQRQMQKTERGGY